LVLPEVSEADGHPLVRDENPLLRFIIRLEENLVDLSDRTPDLLPYGLDKTMREREFLMIARSKPSGDWERLVDETNRAAFPLRDRESPNWSSIRHPFQLALRSPDTFNFLKTVLERVLREQSRQLILALEHPGNATTQGQSPAQDFGNEKRKKPRYSPKPEDPTFCAFVDRIMKDQGRTVNWVANTIKMHRSSISRAKQNPHGFPNTRIALANALGFDPDEILRRFPRKP
jgi:hypothetical protein